MTTVVPVIAFGQHDGTVPAVIQTYTSEGISLGALQRVQQSNNTCTNLQYAVRPTSLRDINIWNEANLTLYADEPCLKFNFGVPSQSFCSISSLSTWVLLVN